MSLVFVTPPSPPLSLSLRISLLNVCVVAVILQVVVVQVDDFVVVALLVCLWWWCAFLYLHCTHVTFLVVVVDFVCW